MTGPDPSAVKATFSNVASRYDLANHLLSGGIDFIWRKKLVSLAKKDTCLKVLDLATGSGDVAFALREGLPGNPEIVGLDFCPPMLDQARKKRDRLPSQCMQTHRSITILLITRHLLAPN